MSMEDSDSLYQLHSSDHPDLVLVFHQLTGPNYHTWRRAMVMALTEKNKLTFINGMLPRPSSTDSSQGVIAWFPLGFLMLCPKR